MSFNGSGTFLRVRNWVNDAASGIKIRADRHDSEDDNFASGLSQCITKDGQTTITANLPMATYRHTGVGAATATTDYARADQVRNGSLYWVAAGGTVDAITAVYTIPTTTLVDGQLFFVRASGANTSTTPTFSPDGLTARNIVKDGGQTLLAGDIPAAGYECIFRYNLANTRYEFLNPAIADGSITAAKLASGAVPSSSTTVEGIVELATNAEVTTGTSTTHAVTPAGLAQLTASETVAGLVERATDAEVTAGTDTTRYITSKQLADNKGLIVNRAFQRVTTRSSVTVAIPFDDTTPQVTEGTEILSVTITPKTTTNILRVRTAVVWGTSNIHSGMALFVNGASDAVASMPRYWYSSSEGPLILEYEFVPASTSLQTLSVRVGASNTTALNINQAVSALVYNSTVGSWITVEEIEA